MTAPLALDASVASLCGKDLLFRVACFFKLVVGVGAENKAPFVRYRFDEQPVQRRHIQIRSRDQSQVRPQAPAALLIRERIEARGIHVLHIWAFAVNPLKLGKVLLKKLSVHHRVCPA